MGKVLKVGAGILLAGAAVVVGVTTQQWGIAAAMGLTGIELIRGAFSGTGAPLSRRQGSILENHADSKAGLPIIYGKTRVGPTLVDVRVDPTSEDRRRLVMVLAWAHGSQNGTGVESIEEIYFDDKLAWRASGSPSGVQAPYDTAIEQTASDPYQTEHLKVYNYMGTDSETVPTVLNDIFPHEWPTDATGKGVAHTVLLMWYNQDIYGGSIPRINAIVKGQKVYDPRPSPPTTSYGTNPALAIRDYLTSTVYGFGIPASQIDDTTFEEAADYCDELVSVPSPDPSQKRFEINGWISSGRPLRSNLAALTTSCRGSVINVGGVWKLLIRQQQSVSGLKITPENTVEGSWRYVLPGANEVPNSIAVSYVDPDRDYQVDTVIWPEPGETNPYLNDDADYEHEIQIDLPFTDNRLRAQQIGMVLLRESREAIGVTIEGKEELLQAEAGDLVEVTNPGPSWTDKQFWVVATNYRVMEGIMELALVEYDSTVYSLDSQFPQPDIDDPNLPDPFSVNPVSSLWLAAGDAESIVTADGVRVPRIKMEWIPPDDEPFLDHYEVQAKRTSESDWDSYGPAPAGDTIFFVTPVTSESWDVRIRVVNTIGTKSDWITDTITPNVTGSNLATLSSEIADDEPYVRFRETDQTLPEGYWQWVLSGNEMRLQKNETTSPYFASPYLEPIRVTAAGTVIIPDAQIPASEITGGTFGSGGFTFPGDLTLTSGGLNRIPFCSTAGGLLDYTPSAVDGQFLKYTTAGGFSWGQPTTSSHDIDSETEHTGFPLDTDHGGTGVDMDAQFSGDRFIYFNSAGQALTEVANTYSSYPYKGENATITGDWVWSGSLTTAASAAGGAGFNVPHGTAPTAPVNGDIWTTTAGLYVRINGATRSYLSADIDHTITGQWSFEHVPPQMYLGQYTAQQGVLVLYGDDLTSQDGGEIRLYEAANTGADYFQIRVGDGAGREDVFVINDLAGTTRLEYDPSDTYFDFADRPRHNGTQLEIVGHTHASYISGSGTDNTVPLWNGTDALDDSIITQTGSTQINVGGLLVTQASVAGGARFRLPHGTAPSSPVNGDMWTTTAGLYTRINGVTKSYLSADTDHTITGQWDFTHTPPQIALGATTATQGVLVLYGDDLTSQDGGEIRLYEAADSTPAYYQIRVGDGAGREDVFVINDMLGTTRLEWDPSDTYFDFAQRPRHAGTQLEVVGHTHAYVGGSGTDNYVALWNGTDALDTSIMKQPGSYMQIEGDLVVATGTGNRTSYTRAYQGVATVELWASTGTEASPLASTSATYTRIRQLGHDGTAWAQGAQIVLQPASTWGSGDHPASITFYTVLDGDTVSTQRWRIEHDGDIRPIADSSYDIGQPSYRPQTIYADTFDGFLLAPASTTGQASLRVPHGTAPTSPVNGDIWSTTAGFYFRVNGTTRSFVSADVDHTITGQWSFEHTPPQIFLGATTATQGILSIYGDDLTSQDGGEIRLYEAADSTPGYYQIRIGDGAGREDVFVINDMAGTTRLEWDPSDAYFDFAQTPRVVGTAVSLAGHTHGAADITAGTFAAASWTFDADSSDDVVTFNNHIVVKGTQASNWGRIGGGSAGISFRDDTLGVQLFYADSAATEFVVIGQIKAPASTTTRASIRLPHGTAPSSPVDGDLWTTTGGLYVRINGATSAFLQSSIDHTITGEWSFEHAPPQFSVGQDTAQIGHIKLWGDDLTANEGGRIDFAVAKNSPAGSTPYWIVRVGDTSDPDIFEIMEAGNPPTSTVLSYNPSDNYWRFKTGETPRVGSTAVSLEGHTHSGMITGSGTDNTIPLWNGTDALDDSIMSESSGIVTLKGSAQSRMVVESGDNIAQASVYVRTPSSSNTSEVILQRALYSAGLQPVTSGTWLGAVSFQGWDGAAYEVGGRIVVNTEQNWTDSPAEHTASLRFMTRDGTGALTSRWDIKGDGDLEPVADSSYNIGSNTVRPATIYADKIDLANDTTQGVYIRDSGGTATATVYIAASNDDTYLNAGTGESLRLSIGGSTKWRLAETTFDLVPGADSSYNIGAATNRPATIYGDNLNVRGAAPIAVVGSGSGDANQAYIEFYDSNGTTRRGLVGDFATTNDDIYLRADTGLIWLVPVGGAVRVDDGNISVVGSATVSRLVTIATWQAVSYFSGQSAQGTEASPAASNVANAAILRFVGYNESDYVETGRIKIEPTQTFTSGVQGTRIVFETTDFNDTVRTARWNVTNGGHWVPMADSTYTVGVDTVRPSTVYADVVDTPLVQYGGTLVLEATGTNNIDFKTNSTTRIRVDANGHLAPVVASTYQCGTPGSPWSNVYTDAISDVTTLTATSQITIDNTTGPAILALQSSVNGSDRQTIRWADSSASDAIRWRFVHQNNANNDLRMDRATGAAGSESFATVYTMANSSGVVTFEDAIRIRNGEALQIEDAAQTGWTNVVYRAAANDDTYLNAESGNIIRLAHAGTTSWTVSTNTITGEAADSTISTVASASLYLTPQANLYLGTSMTDAIYSGRTDLAITWYHRGSFLVEDNALVDSFQVENTGLVKCLRNANEMLRLQHPQATGAPYISWYQISTRRAYMQWYDTTTALRIVAEEAGSKIELVPGGSTEVVIDTTDTYPNTDLGNSLGKDGKRWDELWAQDIMITTGWNLELRAHQTFNHTSYPLTGGSGTIPFLFDGGPSDFFQFNAPTAVEYDNGGTWTSWSPSSLNNAFDGRYDTLLTIDSTHKKFRMEWSSTAWTYCTAPIGVYQEYNNGLRTYTMQLHTWNLFEDLTNGITLNENGASADTIERLDGGSWVTDGVQIGDDVQIANATTSGNNGTFTVTAVSASLITLSVGDLAADESGNTAIDVYRWYDSGTSGSINQYWGAYSPNRNWAGDTKIRITFDTNTGTDIMSIRKICGYTTRKRYPGGSVGATHATPRSFPILWNYDGDIGVRSDGDRIYLTASLAGTYMYAGSTRMAGFTTSYNGNVFIGIDNTYSGAFSEWRWYTRNDGSMGFYDLANTAYRLVIDSSGRLLPGATNLQLGNSTYQWNAYCSGFTLDGMGKHIVPTMTTKTSDFTVNATDNMQKFTVNADSVTMDVSLSEGEVLIVGVKINSSYQDSFGVAAASGSLTFGDAGTPSYTGNGTANVMSFVRYGTVTYAQMLNYGGPTTGW